MTSRVLVLALFAGCSADDPIKDDRPAPEPLAAAHVATEAPKRQGFIGVLTPRGVAEVTAPFTTTVVDFTVKLGDQVDIGTTLARLDEKPLREQLAVAKAALNASKAEAARTSVSRNAAAAALEREKAGAAQGVASKADVADATFKSGEAATMVSKAYADVEQEKARIAALEDKLKHMTLVSPLAGRVSLRYVEAGGRIEEGHPVLRVISSDELFVKFAIPSDQVGHLAPGDKVGVKIEGRSAVVAATVKNVSPELDPVAQMIVAEAELDAPVPEKLQSGMVCQIIPAATEARAGH
jgi:RND family efflux transporter MFP subunit